MIRDGGDKGLQGLTSPVLQTSEVTHWHSNDIRAYSWRRLIYRDANRTALCFQNVLGSYSNLPRA